MMDDSPLLDKSQSIPIPRKACLTSPPGSAEITPPYVSPRCNFLPNLSLTSSQDFCQLPQKYKSQIDGWSQVDTSISAARSLPPQTGRQTSPPSQLQLGGRQKFGDAARTRGDSGPPRPFGPPSSGKAQKVDQARTVSKNWGEVSPPLPPQCQPDIVKPMTLVVPAERGTQRKPPEQPKPQPPRIQFDDSKRRKPGEKRGVRGPASRHSTRHSLFSHLPEYQSPNTLTQNLGFGDTPIHPAVLHVGIKFARQLIVGANARCISMLEAFQQVIAEHPEPPPGLSFSRHCEVTLKRLIQFLVNCRPLSISMGNAINWLKIRIGEAKYLTSSSEAKGFLCESIDRFIEERIVVADRVIAETGADKINDGDVILTCSTSHVVELLLKRAFDLGRKFRVVVVDDRIFLEGKELLERLLSHGLHCTYIFSNGLSYVMADVTKVFLGAGVLLSNGALVSRAGTAIVASVAAQAQVPVIVCCETYKFSERVQLDSICFNQLGDPEKLLQSTSLCNSARQKEVNPALCSWIQKASSETSQLLKCLNLLYDLTPSRYIAMVVTEVGCIPPTSVPVIMREYHTDQMVF